MSVAFSVEMDRSWVAGFAETIESTAVEALVHNLAQLGVEQAYGVSGGGIGLLYDELVRSPIALHHFRHESGAVFAATEAHFASDAPTVAFCTTGPGLINALTGMRAARADGAKVILISGATGGRQAGRWATQETTSYTMPQDALYGSGALFDYAIRVEHPVELPEVFRRLQMGVAHAGGFVAHVALPMSILSQRIQTPAVAPAASAISPVAAAKGEALCAELLRQGPFAVWVGHGARHADREVRSLVERTGATVFCSPRGKGVVSEKHPQFIGVTGLGGHLEVNRYMTARRPDWILVLGSRLSELTSLWDADLKPRRGFLHVDLDREVPGTAYPDCQTIAFQAEIREFLGGLLQHFPFDDEKTEVVPFPRQMRSPLPETRYGLVREGVLMETLQRRVVEDSDALVLSDGGSASVLCNHHLKFTKPRRYRMTSYFGARGHYAAGVVGAALGRGGKAISILSEEAMLMSAEVSSAAQYKAAAVWIVLNRAGHSENERCHEALGLNADNLNFPSVDYATLAESLGARGLRVQSEDQLDEAIQEALVCEGPIVLDVWLDAPPAAGMELEPPVAEVADILGF